MPVTTHKNLTTDQVVWGFRFWWPSRHGVNAGAIRGILHNHINTLKTRKGE